MPILLSHNREDEQEALHISRHLTQNGVVNYVELFDPQLQTTDEITTKLKDRIQQCTHLMIIVSKYTVESWWVPFELGAGSELGRRITSYQSFSSEAPEFLQKWPILKSQKDLDCLIRCYKEDTIVALMATHNDTKRITSFDQFHRELKAALKEENTGGKKGRAVWKA